MSDKKLDKAGFKNTILSDYKLIFECRESSSWQERCFVRKGKFWNFWRRKRISSDCTKVFKNGDFRAGYYRDQVFMTAIGQYSPKHMFTALYGDPEIEQENLVLAQDK